MHICLAHLCSTSSNCRHSVHAVSKVESAWLARKFVLIFLAHLIRSAPACSSGKLVLIYLSHLEKSAHLRCSSEKTVLISATGVKNCSSLLALTRNSVNLSLVTWKKVSIFVGRLKKSAQPPCIKRWTPVVTVVGGRHSGTHLKNKKAHPFLLIWKKVLISSCSSEE